MLQILHIHVEKYSAKNRARARARVLLVDEGPPLAKVSPKPLDVPGSKINLGRHGCQIL